LSQKLSLLHPPVGLHVSVILPKCVKVSCNRYEDSPYLIRGLCLLRKLKETLKFLGFLYQLLPSKAGIFFKPVISFCGMC